MNLYSTGNRSETADFRTAVKRGLAPDGGLYMPGSLPRMPQQFWVELRDLDITGKAERIFEILLSDEFSASQIAEIVDRAFTFDAPVTALDEHMHILELYHGPTLAFKDFGAKAMAAVLSVLARQEGEKITIVTATSGDTGAAVAHGFHNAPGVEVYVLYPSGQVSDLQEKQFTTLGDNITALEVDGNFDDCQRLVKECFTDEHIRAHKQLTTANSINIARLIPQMIYYIHAVTGMMSSGKNGSGSPARSGNIVCSVPSGNFGNLTAGLLAHKMGLPVARFVAATNANHVVPDYLRDGRYRPRSSQRTISNAMDVGDPSNFARILDLYNGSHQSMSGHIKGAWYDDKCTGEAIVEVWQRHRFLMDPHTAVGYLGCRDHLREGERGLVLATAHPAKFPDTINQLLPGVLKTPDRLAGLLDRSKKSVPVSADMKSIREVLLQ